MRTSAPSPAPIRTRFSPICAAWLAAVAFAPGHAQAQDLGPELVFPGDGDLVVSTGTQEAPAVAAGGPGFLAVWEDQRANLAGFAGAAGTAAGGNLIDIYAARFDQAGNLIDTSPIVVSNQGHNQTDPVVAWNGENWLVVFVSQRPDWYFFEDIVGVRVAPDGTVLDPEPFMIRPENNSPANDLGTNPCITSDGTNWFVAWEAIEWSQNLAKLEGTRVAPDGTLLDPSYVDLYVYTSLVFGPEEPSAAFLNGEYLLAWNDFGPVRVRRFDTALNPLAAPFTVPGLLGDAKVAAGASSYLVLATLEASRLDPISGLLDATPIEIPEAAPVFAQSATVQDPDLAWTGTDWVVTYSIPVTGSVFDDPDVWSIRIAPDGTVLDPDPVAMDAGPEYDTIPAVAGGGSGDALFVYTSRPDSGPVSTDIRATYTLSGGVPGSDQLASVGLARQEHLAWVRGDGVHLALFTSKQAGTTRILAQRFDDAGMPIDTEAVLVHQGGEGLALAPAGAWNGTHYYVTWWDATGLILGRRLTADLTVLGFGATPVMQSMDGAPAVGALGQDFLVAASDLFSGDQRWLRAVRVSGESGAVLDASPITVGFDYSFGPRVVALGGAWLVVWTANTCHDCSTYRVFGRRIGADGTPLAGSFLVNGAGEGSGAAVAVAGDRALIAYSDPNAFLQESIEGRILLDDGSFLGGEFEIADPPNRQLFPSVGFDGTDFVVAWSDYREVTGVEQLRADVYAARVTTGGAVIDAGGGFPVAIGVLPEDYPAVTTGTQATTIGYLALAGAGDVPEVQRLHYRVLGAPFCQPDLGFGGPGTTTLSLCGEPLVGAGQADLLVDSDVPLTPVFVAYGTSFLPTPLFGGTIVTVPHAGYLTLVSDANGDAGVPGIQSGSTPAVLYAQALVLDLAQPQSFQISNAIEIELLP